MYQSARQICVFILICILSAVLQCSSIQTAGTGGTGSETVIGKITNEDGTCAAQTVVTLYPCDFDPASGADTFSQCMDTTDSCGNYAITINVSSNRKYTLQAISLPLRTRAVVPDIVPAENGEQTVIAAFSLCKTGSVRVFLAAGAASVKGYAYIPGTSLFSPLVNGCAVIDSVPAQTIQLVSFVDSSRPGAPQCLAENVAVRANAATVVTADGIAHAMKIFLNTTSSGADVTGNVYGFPLLIRLSEGDFDFNESENSGADIRFTKQDNTVLPFEIERWDAASKQAEIWVRIDTVYGSDNSQFILMYWGKAASVLPLSQARVFDSSTGFRGVWHLSEEVSGVGAKGLYKDASGLCNGDDFISSAGRTGIIGYGHEFNGISDYIKFDSPVTEFLKGDVTISLWVNIHDSGGTILSKLDSADGWNEGESSLYLGDGTNNYHNAGLNGARPTFVGHSDDYAIATLSIPNDYWCHLVYTWKWNGDSTGISRFYIDGREVILSRDSVVIRSGDGANATLRIGQPNCNESYSYFKGFMDELEISAAVRSADWIKLCYMNQRKDNLLVKF